MPMTRFAPRTMVLRCIRNSGVIVENIDDVPRAIKEIAEQIGANSLLAQRCIASLPAEEI
jgi:hypothetical protein